MQQHIFGSSIIFVSLIDNLVVRIQRELSCKKRVQNFHMRSHPLYSDRLIAQLMQICGQYMVNISVYGEIFITKAEK